MTADQAIPNKYKTTRTGSFLFLRTITVQYFYMDLFETQLKTSLPSTPLAERMRPRTLDEFFGQSNIVGEGKYLRTMMMGDNLPSLIFWGPPGVGKTTLAQIIAKMTKARFLPLSAVSGGVKDVRDIIKDAEERRKFYGERTILFVDEIHRFNKSQQDAFLPAVEKGIVTLIGATTENPSFEVNSALLSRARVVVLERLGEEDIVKILRQALADKERGLGKEKIEVSNETLTALANIGNGDARNALNTLEIAVKIAPLCPSPMALVPSPSLSQDGRGPQGASIVITNDIIAQALQRTHLVYDRAGEEHYNIISALHKSMRGNDANAALYWLGRMLEAGEDPLYVARRLVRFASEDIGLADPNALVQAVAAHQASHMLGLPECNVILAQCVAYLSNAPKSNALYTAYSAVQQDIRDLPNEPVPLHIRNAPTKLMKNLGCGDAKQEFLPDKLQGKKYLSS
jgi:putative ATPase